jgi:carbon storage regulator
MLVVTRKRNESVMIWDNVEITVIAIRDNQVKLGIDAPREIPVHRKEVYERIQRGEPHVRKGSADAAGEKPEPADDSPNPYDEAPPAAGAAEAAEPPEETP